MTIPQCTLRCNESEVSRHDDHQVREWNSPGAWCCCDAGRPRPSAASSCNLWPEPGSGVAQSSWWPQRGQTAWSQRPGQILYHEGRRPSASPPDEEEEEECEADLWPLTLTWQPLILTCWLSSISCRALISLRAWLGMPSSSLLRATFFRATVSPVWQTIINNTVINNYL